MSDQDIKLGEYALKILDETSAKKLQVEIDSLTKNQTALQEIEKAIALLAKQEQPLIPPESLRECVINSIQYETRYTGFVQRLCELFDLEQEIIEKHLSNLDNVLTEPWEINAFPGTHLLHFDGGPSIAKNADCGFVFVELGYVVPMHRHSGEEWSFILQGQMQEINGSIYCAGDLIHRATGSAHSIKSVGHEPLIFAAILVDGLEFIED